MSQINKTGAAAAAAAFVYAVAVVVLLLLSCAGGFAQSGASDGNVADVPVFDILHDLYVHTHGDQWNLRPAWNFSASPCTWRGICCGSPLNYPNCSDHGDVYLIDLNTANLMGELPASLGELSTLVYLDLSHNQIGGTIPTELGSLQMLRHVSLAFNILRGTIPETFGSLSGLRFLNLEQNVIQSTIPMSLVRLKELRHLDLSENFIIGPLPSFSNRSQEDSFELLSYVDLSSTTINVTVMDFLASMFPSGAQLIDVSNTFINGSFPTVYEFFGMLNSTGAKSTKYFECMMRNPSLHECHSEQHEDDLVVNTLIMSKCLISGTIPSDLFIALLGDHVMEVDLSSNPFIHGELPLNWMYDDDELIRFDARGTDMMGHDLSLLMFSPDTVLSHDRSYRCPSTVSIKNASESHLSLLVDPYYYQYKDCYCLPSFDGPPPKCTTHSASSKSISIHYVMPFGLLMMAVLLFVVSVNHIRHRRRSSQTLPRQLELDINVRQPLLSSTTSNSRKSASHHPNICLNDSIDETSDDENVDSENRPPVSFLSGGKAILQSIFHSAVNQFKVPTTSPRKSTPSGSASRSRPSNSPRLITERSPISSASGSVSASASGSAPGRSITRLANPNPATSPSAPPRSSDQVFDDSNLGDFPLSTALLNKTLPSIGALHNRHTQDRTIAFHKLSDGWLFLQVPIFAESGNPTPASASGLLGPSAGIPGHGDVDSTPVRVGIRLYHPDAIRSLCTTAAASIVSSGSADSPDGSSGNPRSRGSAPMAPSSPSSFSMAMLNSPEFLQSSFQLLMRTRDILLPANAARTCGLVSDPATDRFGAVFPMLGHSEYSLHDILDTPSSLAPWSSMLSGTHPCSFCAHWHSSFSAVSHHRRSTAGPAAPPAAPEEGDVVHHILLGLARQVLYCHRRGASVGDSLTPSCILVNPPASSSSSSSTSGPISVRLADVCAGRMLTVVQRTDFTTLRRGKRRPTGDGNGAPVDGGGVSAATLPSTAAAAVAAVTSTSTSTSSSSSSSSSSTALPRPISGGNLLIYGQPSMGMSRSSSSSSMGGGGVGEATRSGRFGTTSNPWSSTSSPVLPVPSTSTNCGDSDLFLAQRDDTYSFGCIMVMVMNHFTSIAPTTGASAVTESYASTSAAACASVHGNTISHPFVGPASASILGSRSRSSSTASAGVHPLPQQQSGAPIPGIGASGILSTVPMCSDLSSLTPNVSSLVSNSAHSSATTTTSSASFSPSANGSPSPSMVHAASYPTPADSSSGPRPAWVINPAFKLLARLCLAQAPELRPEMSSVVLMLKSPPFRRFLLCSDCRDVCGRGGLSPDDLGSLVRAFLSSSVFSEPAADATAFVPTGPTGVTASQQGSSAPASLDPDCASNPVNCLTRPSSPVINPAPSTASIIHPPRTLTSLSDRSHERIAQLDPARMQTYESQRALTVLRRFRLQFDASIAAGISSWCSPQSMNGIQALERLRQFQRVCDASANTLSNAAAAAAAAANNGPLGSGAGLSSGSASTSSITSLMSSGAGDHRDHHHVSSLPRSSSTSSSSGLSSSTTSVLSSPSTNEASGISLGARSSVQVHGGCRLTSDSCKVVIHFGMRGAMAQSFHKRSRIGGARTGGRFSSGSTTSMSAGGLGGHSGLSGGATSLPSGSLRGSGVWTPEIWREQIERALNVKLNDASHFRVLWVGLNPVGVLSPGECITHQQPNRTVSGASVSSAAASPSLSGPSAPRFRSSRTRAASMSSGQSPSPATTASLSSVYLDPRFRGLQCWKSKCRDPKIPSSVAELDEDGLSSTTAASASSSPVSSSSSSSATGSTSFTWNEPGNLNFAIVQLPCAWPDSPTAATVLHSLCSQLDIFDIAPLVSACALGSSTVASSGPSRVLSSQMRFTGSSAASSIPVFPGAPMVSASVPSLHPTASAPSASVSIPIPIPAPSPSPVGVYPSALQIQSSTSALSPSYVSWTSTPPNGTPSSVSGYPGSTTMFGSRSTSNGGGPLEPPPLERPISFQSALSRPTDPIRLLAFLPSLIMVQFRNVEDFNRLYFHSLHSVARSAGGSNVGPTHPTHDSSAMGIWDYLQVQIPREEWITAPFLCPVARSPESVAAASEHLSATGPSGSPDFASGNLNGLSTSSGASGGVVDSFRPVSHPVYHFVVQRCAQWTSFSICDALLRTFPDEIRVAQPVQVFVNQPIHRVSAPTRTSIPHPYPSASSSAAAAAAAAAESSHVSSTTHSNLPAAAVPLSTAPAHAMMPTAVNPTSRFSRRSSVSHAEQRHTQSTMATPSRESSSIYSSRISSTRPPAPPPQQSSTSVTPSGVGSASASSSSIFSSSISSSRMNGNPSESSNKVDDLPESFRGLFLGRREVTSLPGTRSTATESLFASPSAHTPSVEPAPSTTSHRPAIHQPGTPAHPSDPDSSEQPATVSPTTTARLCSGGSMAAVMRRGPTMRTPDALPSVGGGLRASLASFQGAAVAPIRPSWSGRDVVNPSPSSLSLDSMVGGIDMVAAVRTSLSQQSTDIANELSRYPTAVIVFDSSLDTYHPCMNVENLQYVNPYTQQLWSSSRDDGSGMYRTGQVMSNTDHCSFMVGIYRMNAAKYRDQSDDQLVSKYSGVCSEVPMVVINGLLSTEVHVSSSIMAALDFVTQLLTKTSHTTKFVLSFSFEIDVQPRDWFCTTIDDMALRPNVILCAPAGNAGRQVTDLSRYPAQCPHAVVIGGLDRGIPWDRSNYGTRVNFWAPATDIVSNISEYLSMIREDELSDFISLVAESSEDVSVELNDFVLQHLPQLIAPIIPNVPAPHEGTSVSVAVFGAVVAKLWAENIAADRDEILHFLIRNAVLKSGDFDPSGRGHQVFWMPEIDNLSNIRDRKVWG